MRRPARLLLPFLLASSLAFARSHWSELNIGPFRVDFDADEADARQVLTDMEQTRCVLGNLLESKDLESVWPIRVIITPDAQGSTGVVSQLGEWTLRLKPGEHVPLGQLAGILLDDNTPTLPAEAEKGLRQLFGTLQANGARVTWGGPILNPDLAYARMELFATNFEYGADFHIFVSSLRNASPLRVAERNAFNTAPEELEEKAKQLLASVKFQRSSVSGRPLDPKHDFGDHPVQSELVEAYLKNTEAAFRDAVNADGPAAAVGFQGLGQWDEAIRAGSQSAAVYVGAAQTSPDPQALDLLKRAEQLNPRWAQPFFLESKLRSDPKQKQELLKKATELDPRGTEYWLELARVQMGNGHADLARGSWLRAEDSAPEGPERDKVHQMRLDSEQARQQAEEAEDQRVRNSARLEDEQARTAMMARIHQAEQKANGEAAADDDSGAVPWSQIGKQRTVSGSLKNVVCEGTSARLTVQPQSGSTVTLRVQDPAKYGLACGHQAPGQRITAAYLDGPGTVIRLKLQ